MKPQLPERLKSKGVSGARERMLSIGLKMRGAEYPLLVETSVTGLSDDSSCERGSGQGGSESGWNVVPAEDDIWMTICIRSSPCANLRMANALAAAGRT